MRNDFWESYRLFRHGLLLIMLVVLVPVLVRIEMGRINKPEIPVTTPAVTPEPPAVLSMEAVADPSMAAADIADPYAALNKYTKAIYQPDPALYNALYRAVDAMQESFDLTPYKHLVMKEKVAACESLYAEAGYRFFYMRFAKVSKNGKEARFTYIGDPEEIRRDKETLTARLSHLCYNVAPQNGSDLQKNAAVYQFLCEHANYSADSSDETTFSPAGILLKGQGICGGYADLAYYTLTRLGVNAEYISNMAHAWNIVQVDGKWYHMDVTFGAGMAGSTQNSIHYLFMDDETRMESLANNLVNTSEPIQLGYPAEAPVPPPACTDESMRPYSALWNYALDIDAGKVYFSDADGIHSMNLDCTGTEKIANVPAYQMAVWNGEIYYISAEDGFLYRLIPYGESRCLFHGAQLGYLAIKGGMLYYGESFDGSGCKTIPLIRAEEWNTESFFSVNDRVPRERSFRIDVHFSLPMDTSAYSRRFVLLTDETGAVLDARLSWSADGKTLSVRPADYVDGLSGVTLYLRDGAAAADGGMLPQGHKLRVDIVAGQ